MSGLIHSKVIPLKCDSSEEWLLKCYRRVSSFLSLPSFKNKWCILHTDWSTCMAWYQDQNFHWTDGKEFFLQIEERYLGVVSLWDLDLNYLKGLVGGVTFNLFYFPVCAFQSYYILGSNIFDPLSLQPLESVLFPPSLKFLLGRLD